MCRSTDEKIADEKQNNDNMLDSRRHEQSCPLYLTYLTNKTQAESSRSTRTDHESKLLCSSDHRATEALSRNGCLGTGRQLSIRMPISQS
jgi:hypothetical protein